MSSEFIPYQTYKDMGAYRMETTVSELLGERCERVRHKSGLTVLHVPKGMQQTYVMLLVHFGAMDVCFDVNGARVQTPDGIAHFLEHKLFARPDGSDANELLSAYGAESNAWTDYDKTAYLYTTTEHPVCALPVLLDFVFHPYFTEQNVQKERGIIAEEISMGLDDPWQRLQEQTVCAMYREHPLRRRICGTLDSIEHITPEQLYACHRAFYRPSNAYLIVCGGGSLEDIMAAVDAADLGSAQGADPTKHSYDERQVPVNTRVSGEFPLLSQPLLQIAWRDDFVASEPRERLRREILMDLLGEILFSRAGDFYRGMFESGELSTSYSYGYSSTTDAAYYAIAAESDHPEQVYDAFRATVGNLRERGVSRADFEHYRRVLYASYVSEFDFPEDVADLVCEAEGMGCGVFDTLSLLGEITYEQLCEQLTGCFDEDKTVFSTLYPQAESE